MGKDGTVIGSMNDTTIGTGLVVMGGTPVLNVGVVTALQTDPRIRLLPHSLDAAGAAVPDDGHVFDVLAVLTDTPIPELLQDWERLDPSGGARRLLLRRQADRDDALAAIHAGLRGYAILAPLLADDLVAGIVLLARYGVWLCPLTTQMLVSDDRVGILAMPSQPMFDGTNDQAGLSERELEVLRYGSAGFSEAMTAEQLSLAQNTVKTYWRRICAKLDVVTRSEAIVLGIQLGIVPDRRQHAKPPAAGSQRLDPLRKAR
jgi:two-component system, NarL family, response regulator YdfI